MNKNILLFKILSPIAICLLYLLMFKNIDYYPLFLGLIIGVFNKGRFKVNFLFGCVLSVLFSYISIFGGVLSFFGTLELIKVIENIFSIIGEDMSYKIAYVLSISIISPLLFIYLFKFLFNYSKKYNFILVISLGILMIIEILLFENIEKVGDSSIVFFVNPNSAWQIIVLLIVQLSIYKDSILKE